ncbi:hypothetical protein [Rhizobium sp. CSW-27]|nr:hypothetical protein [Rhizobium sp. CSW-27]MBT9369566.1 hypothetical protein [Rhizobium sp. CSW-27]
MQNFQRLLESPALWFVDLVDAIRQRHRRSVSRRREADLRRRYMNG